MIVPRLMRKKQQISFLLKYNPYATDIYVGYAKLDVEFEKVDLVDLISKLDKAIEKEFES